MPDYFKLWYRPGSPVTGIAFVTREEEPRTGIWIRHVSTTLQCDVNIHTSNGTHIRAWIKPDADGVLWYPHMVESSVLNIGFFEMTWEESFKRRGHG